MKKLDNPSALSLLPLSLPPPPAHVWVVMWTPARAGAPSGAPKHLRGEPGTIEDIVTDEESALQLAHHLDGMVSIHKYVLSP